MICNRCGQTIAENSQFCGTCGQPVNAPASAQGVSASSSQFSGTPETSGLAIGSLIAGIFLFIFPAAVAAIVLGHIARSNIRKSAGRLSGDGIALAGLVLGYMGIAFIPVILIIAAIAIPNLLRARIAANETSAAASMRTIVTAESAYFTEHPSSGYTCTLSDIREFTGDRLATGRSVGYAFEIRNCSGETGGPNNKYQVVAWPINPNSSGMRVFCSDESQVIRSASSEEECLQNGMAIH